jgi:putative nucleotidyltransferase with HDIG domain
MRICITKNTLRRKGFTGRALFSQWKNSYPKKSVTVVTVILIIKCCFVFWEINLDICTCGGCETCKSELYSDAIRCMVTALEYRDPYTKGHSFRVGEMAAFVARYMSFEKSDIIKIHIAGQLHDIGKIGISDHILLKNGKLNDDERQSMENHSKIGADILNESSHLEEIANVVEQHHERWDGNGYPNNLKNYEISLGARILALCDALDAMASSRPYRSSLSWENIENEMVGNLGIQFDPQFASIINPLIDFWKSNYIGGPIAKTENQLILV